MTKSMRKYRSVLMAGLMILLMVAWLAAPAARGVGEIQKGRVVAHVDGKAVTIENEQVANREISGLHAVLPEFFSGLVGMEERDPTHWMLLTREAEGGGYVGETGDGKASVPTMAMEMLQTNRMLGFQLQQQGIKTQDEAVQFLTTMIMSRMRTNQMTDDEIHKAVARFRGVDRMLRAYRGADRVSDREAAALAKKELDAAVADVVFIPASLTSAAIPDPDAAALQAHFDLFKGTKPGEGEFGIGYFLPRRVKLEYLTLKREDFEKAVDLDPIEVQKRYKQQRTKYPGEIAIERANVERDMRGEAADRAMDTAQQAVQAEVLKVTRLLDSDGKYKRLPAEWEQRRPRFERIAQVVVDEVKKTGLTIPLPEVTVKAGMWLTEQDLSQLPGIGFSSMRLGGTTRRFGEVIAWTRELGSTETGPIPVQVGIPVVEGALTDGSQNRYCIAVLATRAESAPDSVDEIKDKAVKDFKELRAFEALKTRIEEFRSAAVAGGLEAVVTAAMPPAPVIADPAKKDDGKPEIRTAVRVTRKYGGDSRVDEEKVRDAVVDAAAVLDPTTPYGAIDAEKGTLALAAPKNRGVAVFRLLAYSPLTREDFRRYADAIERMVQREGLTAKPGTPDDPFSLPSLLRRHDYVVGDTPIRTVEQLKRNEKVEG